MKNLQLYLLKDTYNTIQESTEAQALFGAIQALAIKGYKAFHGDHVKPFSQECFISDWLVLYQDEKPAWIAKLVPIQRYDQYSIEQSILSAYKNDNLNNYELIKNYLNQKNNQSTNYYYAGTTTYDPEIVKDPNLVKETIAYTQQYYYDQENVDAAICTASIRAKFNKSLSMMGWEEVHIPYVKYKNLHNNEAAVMNYVGPNQYVFEMMDKYSEVWDKRIVLAPNKNIITKKAA